MNQHRRRPDHGAVRQSFLPCIAGTAQAPSDPLFDSTAHARYGHRLSQSSPSAPVLQRVAEDDKEEMQMKAAGHTAARPNVPAASGGGSPLPPPVRGKMERSFGHSLSDVRIHSGGEAKQVGALAYTRGSDIHFQPGLYAPDSLGGQELLGHELTHVIQQRAGLVSTPQNKAVGSAPINADAGLEAEADALGARAARGESAVVSGVGSGTQAKADPGAPIQCKGPGVLGRIRRLIGRGDASAGGGTAAPEEENGLHPNPLWERGGDDAGMNSNPLWQAGGAMAPVLDTAPPTLDAPHADIGAGWATAQSTPRALRMNALGTRAGSVTPSGPQLPGILPGAEYKDEDKKFGWRAAMDPALMAVINGPDPVAAAAAQERKQRGEERTDVRLTKYLTPEQRAGHAVTADDSGLLTRANGKLLNTKNGIGGGLNPTGGTEIFAMGTDGSLHAADVDRQSSARRQKFLTKQAQYGVPQKEALAEVRRRGKIDELFHHSSFFAGGEVAGAGEIAATKGRVTEISDQSGHYKPKAETTFNAVSHMAKLKAEGGLGVSLMDGDAKEARVRLGAKPGLGGNSVSLPVSSFLQTGGNEKQIRAKQGMRPELEFYAKNQGVVNATDSGVDKGPQISPSQVHASNKGARDASAPDWMKQLPARPRSAFDGPYGWLQDTEDLGASGKSPYLDNIDLSDHASGPSSAAPHTPYSISYVGAEGATDDTASSPYMENPLGSEAPLSPYTSNPLSVETSSPYTINSLLEETVTDEGSSHDASDSQSAATSPYAHSLSLNEESLGESLMSETGSATPSSSESWAYTNDPMGLEEGHTEELPPHMQD